MPKQALPTGRDFERLKRELLHMGFRILGTGEFKKQFARLGLRAPRPRPGRETGFIFHANGLSVYVWTTWLRSEGRARSEDTGWVVLCDGDDAVHFAQPVHRTKYFVDNLLKRAWIERKRALLRPLCRDCRQFMRVAKGKALKSRYWRCDNVHEHADRKPARLDWDSGMPEKARQYLLSLRKARARTRERRRAEGKSTDIAALKRKAWQRTKSPK